MENFKNSILRGKYFDINSKNRLKAIVLNLLMLLAIFIMIIDVYGSIQDGYIAISIIEVTSAIILSITYLLFFNTISLQHSIYITIIVIAFLFIISLTLPAENAELVFFWLPTLPIHIYFFLGTKLGNKWSIAIVLTLILTTLNVYFVWLEPLYSINLLSQVTIGYITVSYLMFILEKERQRYEDSLYQTKIEKEVLLKEVHHRTKNNMQIIISLLDMQSDILEDSTCSTILKSNVNRLKAMSYLHEYLYSGLEYDKINLKIYLKKVVDNLQLFTPHKISFKSEKIILDLSYSTTIGLILNEIVTNAIQHAYNIDEVGKIDINLSTKDNQYIILIEDYGIGFENNDNDDSLGMILIYDLLHKLPNGKIDIKNQNGTKIKILFDKEF
ncbi:Sensory transduction histidine kinase [hydrothermal vent metagenome]|uniref:histidine kinase n=1 Tax=hydrothermal vent metagenome TaxID=652676 RepID=A0A1W1BQU4_9ZZZZ